MPELPEVETTRRGLEKWGVGQHVRRIRVHDPRLRWPVDPQLGLRLHRRKLLAIDRRAKYLLFHFHNGTLIGHLGMSGSMRITKPQDERRKHDHVEFEFSNGKALRYHDPRRFGFLIWTENDPTQHPRLRDLGPEPFCDSFDGTYLAKRAVGRKVATKTFLMDPKVVVGVGNIYASESLYRAGIRPGRAAGRVARTHWERLATEVRAVLSEAIADGGTTLRDFLGSDGEPGYFVQNLQAYGREGEPCHHCSTSIRRSVISQRASYFCPSCQQ
ncbi:MAG: bifunctional DNA-formamidopyrimidine glycosylase/DNA-(apurinic or apyrimidinic site) lyase [Planctomycetes bacterium]|nr:bifunctional DNA-formamidopyrimidine glycosylase/DNA-(apurinic or apyrimidinic site) lyase [Planctomycetota bacterium]